MEEALWLLFKKFMAAWGAAQKSDTWFCCPQPFKRDGLRAVVTSMAVTTIVLIIVVAAISISATAMSKRGCCEHKQKHHQYDFFHSYLLIS